MPAWARDNSIAIRVAFYLDSNGSETGVGLKLHENGGGILRMETVYSSNPADVPFSEVIGAWG